MTERTYDISYTQDRELSWLKFNDRVLDEAFDVNNPLLERLKFLAIVNSNLDEFFMIRVGSITDMKALKPKKREDKKNMTPEEELKAIYESSRSLSVKMGKCFKKIEDELVSKDIFHARIKDLSKEDRKYLEKYYINYIEPVLSPQIIDPHHPFPHLENKGLYVAVLLKNKKDKSLTFGIVPIPKKAERITLLLSDNKSYVLLEEIVLEYVHKVFDQYQIADKAVISVIRNADIAFEGIDYDEDEDLSDAMKKLLKKRQRLAPVLLKIEGKLDKRMVDFLKEHLHLTSEKVFVYELPLDMSYAYEFKKVFKNIDDLYYDGFKPCVSKNVDPNESMIKQALDHDILLSYPYESMDDYIRLIKEAARDPNVIAIKITIYRLAKKAKLIKYLCEASENGKDVTVLMELRARFDEENNINWAESLEESGVRVMYGMEYYKVHSKITVITRMENNRLEVITQIGTGNFNENTARLYTDLSLITSDKEIGKDALHFFNNMATGNLNGEYSELLVAPNSLKNKILEMIDLEIMKAKQGEEGYIAMKINSLSDREIIDHFAMASSANVKIDLMIRGITCLLPHIEGKTDNIHIESIVGRFLEHARIYIFGKGNDAKVYISSADMMTRNTEKRVEIAAPVKDPEVKRELFDYLKLQFADNVKARIMNENGDYILKKQDADKLIDSQDIMLKRAKENEPEIRSADLKKDGPLRKLFKSIFTR